MMKFTVQTTNDYEAKAILNAVDMKQDIREALDYLRNKVKYTNFDEDTKVEVENIQKDIYELLGKYVDDM